MLVAIVNKSHMVSLPCITALQLSQNIAGKENTLKKGKLLCKIKIEILGNLMTIITAHFIQKNPWKRYDVNAIRDNKRDQVFTPS